MMKFKIWFDKGDTNYHGTQAKGEPWNQETVRGWKLVTIDLLPGIKMREKHNPEGGKTRAIWYKRIIIYKPSGACWYVDMSLVK